MRRVYGDVIKKASEEYAEAFGRDHGGMLWKYESGDAEILITGLGSVASEATVAVDMLREEGIKAGVIGMRVYRPFPRADAVKASVKANHIIVLGKSISYGYEGGLCSDLKGAFYGSGIKATVDNYIVGLGGRDVNARGIVHAVKTSISSAQG